MADAEILGLRAIAKHLGVSVPGLRALVIRDGFLVYRKVLPRVRPGARAWCWVTTPSLIHAWRVSKAKIDREAFIAGSRSTRKADGDAASQGRARVGS